MICAYSHGSTVLRTNCCSLKGRWYPFFPQQSVAVFKFTLLIRKKNFLVIWYIRGTCSPFISRRAIPLCNCYSDNVSLTTRYMFYLTGLHLSYGTSHITLKLPRDFSGSYQSFQWSHPIAERKLEIVIAREIWKFITSNLLCKPHQIQKNEIVIGLQMSFPNPLKPGLISRMKI